jgi:hypothetical protein
MLLPPEPVQPLHPEIVQDVTIYEYMGVYFKTAEAAAATIRNREVVVSYFNVRVPAPCMHLSLPCGLLSRGFLSGLFGWFLLSNLDRRGHRSVIADLIAFATSATISTPIPTVSPTFIHYSFLSHS